VTPASGERLEIERSGGFGGMTLRTSVPLAELGHRERAAVEECFAHSPAAPSGPDRFVYRFRMGGRVADVQEDRVPDELQPLLDRLSSSWRR
jgi:hypothetical protein